MSRLANNSLRARTADRQSFSWDMGENIPHFTVTDFDVTDISNYTDSLRTRIDRENTRDNEIKSARLDFEYILDSQVFTSVQAGLRTSELSFLQYGGNQGNGSRNEFTLDTYDNVCFSQAVVASQNGEFGYPEVEYENSGTIDVTEKTNSAYIMASYDTEMFDKFIRGNFGVRIVDTEVTSVGFRSNYTVVTGDDGILRLATGDTIERTVGGGDYTEVLPSFNLVIDYSDDILIRGGIYRGMSRADPSDMGYSREFEDDDDSAPTTINDLLITVDGSGNPDTQPLMSWNYDVAFEWYPNEDSIFAFGLYYKQFQGGFQQQEASVAYRWDNGIGIKVGYNFADTDFEFEDSLYGDTFITDVDGNTTQLTAGIVDPASVPGFSEHVFSTQVYYQIGDLDTAIIYKYRSEYFQPYTSNGTRLRYVDEVGVWEARMSYKVNEHVRVKLEAINLFSAPKSQDYYVQGNLGEVNDYGPRLFAGVSLKY